VPAIGALEPAIGTLEPGSTDAGDAGQQPDAFEGFCERCTFEIHTSHIPEHAFRRSGKVYCRNKDACADYLADVQAAKAAEVEAEAVDAAAAGRGQRKRKGMGP